MASENTKPYKRKHKVLSVEDKVTIIRRLENGETAASLAKIYNVGRATVFDIKTKKDELLKFALKINSHNGSKKRKTMKKVGNEQLENALYSWYLQMRNQGENITGPLLCARALQLNQIYEGSSEFKASSGWLRNFKCRYGIGIRELEMQGDEYPAAEYYEKVITEEEPIKKEDTVDAKETEEEETGPSHAEAFVALETTIEWWEQQVECNSEEMQLLRKIRDLAAEKHKLEWKKSKIKTNMLKSR